MPGGGGMWLQVLTYLFVCFLRYLTILLPTYRCRVGCKKILGKSSDDFIEGQYFTDHHSLDTLPSKVSSNCRQGNHLVATNQPCFNVPKYILHQKKTLRLALKIFDCQLSCEQGHRGRRQLQRKSARGSSGTFFAA